MKYFEKENYERCNESVSHKNLENKRLQIHTKKAFRIIGQDECKCETIKKVFLHVSQGKSNNN
jgi:hypothetical protein